mmetsp:Transcript_47318/g.136709  ORF Transcript_47318/g.136709 Transcript_47318/m.136709 type:complete len:356 (+) Transcript_47318:77-1144(+)
MASSFSASTDWDRFDRIEVVYSTKVKYVIVPIYVPYIVDTAHMFAALCEHIHELKGLASEGVFLDPDSCHEPNDDFDVPIVPGTNTMDPKAPEPPPISSAAPAPPPAAGDLGSPMGEAAVDCPNDLPAINSGPTCLDRDTRMKKFREGCKLYDLDGTGFIDCAEFVGLLCEMDFTEEEVDEVMREVDPSGIVGRRHWNVNIDYRKFFDRFGDMDENGDENEADNEALRGIQLQMATFAQGVLLSLDKGLRGRLPPGTAHTLEEAMHDALGELDCYDEEGAVEQATLERKFKDLMFFVDTILGNARGNTGVSSDGLPVLAAAPTSPSQPLKGTPTPPDERRSSTTPEEEDANLVWW